MRLFDVRLLCDCCSTYIQIVLQMFLGTVSSARTLRSRMVYGIVSPVLFCIYIDGLLCAIRESGVGCYIGHVFVGALAYADDVTLLAPTPQAMRHMLKICVSADTLI